MSQWCFMNRWIKTVNGEASEKRRHLEATEEIAQIRARWQAVSMNLLSTSTEKE